MKFKLVFLLMVFLSTPEFAFSQSGLPMNDEIVPEHPKREVRGTWISTVLNLDWPILGASAQSQKDDLIKIFDDLYESNINVIYFQVRPVADCFYKSEIVPWSYYLTGVQGNDPGYDPLEFAIIEAHKRGIELHAWLNPLRSTKGSYSLAANHVLNEHPDWEMVGKYIINPGLPEVRQHIVDVVEEIVKNYDIDGIHFDDFFYSYNGTSLEDDEESYNNYNPEGLPIFDWRRDNIDKMITGVQTVILENNIAQQKGIVFGISPSGIWKAGNPPGISGTSSYSAIYVNSKKWLEEQMVDYLMPQLYWEFGGGQDYESLSGWWDDIAESGERYLMPGLASYKLNDSHDWPKEVIINQVKESRSLENENTYGVSFFRSDYVTEDIKGVSSTLVEEEYKYTSFSPAYMWVDNVHPYPPGKVTLVDNTLSWTPSPVATDGDYARRYVVYRFDDNNFVANDYYDGTNIVTVTYNTTYEIADTPAKAAEDTGVYVVTALDDVNNESFATIANDNGLGLSVDVNEVIEINMYPNPAKGIVSVDLTNGTKNIVVFDVVGKTVYNTTTSASNVSIDVNNWSRGIYFVNVYQNGIKKVSRLIKE